MKKSLFLLLLVSTCAWGTMYQTNFPSTENPLSESGNWINGLTTGIKWANCRSTPGFAFGTQTLQKSYDDSTCVLTGNWGPSQTVQATVKVAASDSAAFEEVELRVHTTVTAKDRKSTRLNSSHS